MPEPQPATRSNPALIAVTWLVVVLPTLWGLSYTVKNAMKLFTAHTPAASAPVAPAGTTPPKP